VTPPLITVGIPTYNRSSYLARAILSVLNQTYPHLEILISNNCSTDDTSEVIKSFTDHRIRYIEQQHNLGATGNYDAVLRASQGELFFMLSDDDYLAPTAMERLSQPFREALYGAQPEDIGISWCPCVNVDGEGNRLWVVHGGPPIESSLSMMLGLFDGTRGPQFCGVMIRTADGIRLGGFDNERFGVLSDSVPWGKTALSYKYVVCVSEPLVYYTMHAGLTGDTTTCSEWQRFASNQIDTFAALREEMGDFAGARRIRWRRPHLLANITVTILMRQIGRPGWVMVFLREFWRSRRFMLTPFVLKRAVRDGWKLLRLKGR
jgi:glycosyltransferase involved in cell wall biosynthesis